MTDVRNSGTFEAGPRSIAEHLLAINDEISKAIAHIAHESSHCGAALNSLAQAMHENMRFLVQDVPALFPIVLDPSYKGDAPHSTPQAHGGREIVTDPVSAGSGVEEGADAGGAPSDVGQDAAQSAQAATPSPDQFGEGTRLPDMVLDLYARRTLTDTQLIQTVLHAVTTILVAARGRADPRVAAGDEHTHNVRAIHDHAGLVIDGARKRDRERVRR